MKRFLTPLSLFLAAAAAILAVSFLAPLSIPYYQDFSVMYYTNLGRLNGLPIYDYPAQLAFIQTLTPAGFTFHPYPYPPWYALATLCIALLPIQVAARVWFFLNLAMIGGSIWLLTPRWQPIPRLLGGVAAVLFIPAFGLLIVGQYSAPVLLGAALFAWAARKQASAWAAAGLLLLTFKPHIGAILFLAGFGWLVVQGRRRAAWMTVLGGLLLAGLGFLADPAWPLTYLQSLGRYRDIPGVQTCGQCASLPVTLVRVVTGQSSTAAAAWVSLVLAGVGIWLVWRYRARLKDPIVLTAFAALLTLLIDPYLLNYDHLLLLLPLTVLWIWNKKTSTRLVLTVVYLLPWGALALGPAGNQLLPLLAVVLLGVLWKKSDEFASFA
jgi:hypothetical protein